MVYGQTGVFFAFFLPSGALLFTTGVWVATGEFHYSVAVVCCMLILAAMLGNITGYWFGRKAGPLLYRRKDSALFKRKHLSAAHDFYRKYGGLALAAGPFFPVIRTFSPIVAGMIRLNFRRFLFFSAIGSALWIISFVMSGYLLGIIPALKPYLKYVVIGIIVTVTVPIVIRVAKEFNRAGKKPPTGVRQKESEDPDHLY
jgi:membrane-associated protein